MEQGANVEIPMLGLAGLSAGEFWETRIPRPIKYAGISGKRGQRPVLRAVCYRSEEMACPYWTRYVKFELREDTE
jgi:hypothetical protein